MQWWASRSQLCRFLSFDLLVGCIFHSCGLRTIHLSASQKSGNRLDIRFPRRKASFNLFTADRNPRSRSLFHSILAARTEKKGIVLKIARPPPDAHLLLALQIVVELREALRHVRQPASWHVPCPKNPTHQNLYPPPPSPFHSRAALEKRTARLILTEKRTPTDCIAEPCQVAKVLGRRLDSRVAWVRTPTCVDIASANE